MMTGMLPPAAKGLLDLAISMPQKGPLTQVWSGRNLSACGSVFRFCWRW